MREDSKSSCSIANLGFVDVDKHYWTINKVFVPAVGADGIKVSVSRYAVDHSIHFWCKLKWYFHIVICIAIYVAINTEQMQ